MTRYTLHVPEQKNDGSLIPDEWFQAIELDILDIGGGFTTVPGIGGWRGDSQTYREPVRLYMIDTDDAPATARELKALAQRVALAFEQEAVYLTRQDVETFLVAPAREEIAS